VSKLVTNGCSMTWGGGFTYGNLIKVAEENNMSMCRCVSYIRRRKKLDNTYHGPNYGVLPNEPELGVCKNNCTPELARKSITYPQKLAKLLGSEELFDLSKPGESCQYVVRTTIDFFLKKIEEHTDLSDYIVVLQLPIGLRFEYWNDDIKNSSVPPSKGWKSYMIAQSDSKDIIYYFGTERYSFYNMTNSVIQLGSFLKENNIRYYISTEGESFENLSKEDDIAKRRIEYINTNYSILGGQIDNSSLVGKEVKAREVHIPEDGHYSEHGHTVAANNIYRLINDR